MNIKEIKVDNATTDLSGCSMSHLKNEKVSDNYFITVSWYAGPDLDLVGYLGLKILRMKIQHMIKVFLKRHNLKHNKIMKRAALNLLAPNSLKRPQILKGPRDIQISQLNSMAF